MPLKPDVQHLVSKTVKSVTEQEVSTGLTSLIKEKRQNPHKPESPRGSGPRSPSPRSPWDLPLPGVPLPGAHPALDRGAASASGRKKLRRAGEPGRGPRRGGRSAARNGAQARALPGPQPRRAPPLPLPKSHLESRALKGSPWLCPVTNRVSAGPFCATVRPTWALQDTATSSGRAPVASSPGLTPRVSGRFFPSLSSPWAAAARSVAELSPQSPPGAAIRSPRRLRRLPSLASAEPAAVHVAPELAGSPERAESRAQSGRRGRGRRGEGGEGGERARGAGTGRRKGRAARSPGARPAPARPAPGPGRPGKRPLPGRPPAPPVTPGGRCSRDRSRPHPASPLPRLQPPPAELHYARQFRHFAKTKTRGRRKRRTGRARRRRERRTARCEPGRGPVFGTTPPLVSPEPLISKAAETPACLRLR